MSEPFDIERRVRDFVSETTAVPLGKVEEKTRLYGDCGLYGDDAREFMFAFARHFSVDLTDFDFSRYIGPEAGFSLFLSLYNAILGTKNTLKDITVSQLIFAAQTGKWATEI